MTRGKPYSADLCQFIYELSHTYSVEDIAQMAKRPPRTIYRIIAKGKAGSNFQPKPRRIRGSYSLSEEDVQVCVLLVSLSPAHCWLQFLIMLIQRTPDLLLDELRDRFLEGTGTKVASSTIYRAYVVPVLREKP